MHRSSSIGCSDLPTKEQQLILYSLAIFKTYKSQGNEVFYFWLLDPGDRSKFLLMCDKIFYNNDMLYSLNSYFCNAKEAQWRWNRKSLSFKLHQTQKFKCFQIFDRLCNGERATFCKKMHKSCKQRELRPISNGSEKYKSVLEAYKF